VIKIGIEISACEVAEELVILVGKIQIRKKSKFSYIKYFIAFK